MIYLDYNATTPVFPEVLESMLPYLKDDWGNAASTYRFGSKLKSVIELAREKVACLLGASPVEILFTSCGTESNNAAINAALVANPTKKHLITCVTEHSSVLSQFKHLEKRGYRITYLSVDQEGLIDPSDLENAITEETAIVSIMWANNETGVLSPVQEIGAICHSRGISYHCDAVQAAGKLPINLKNLPIDYLSITGHKIGAPKGTGALYVRKKTPFSPYLFGGHQERERRGGTEPVFLLVGLGTAAENVKKGLSKYGDTISELRNTLEGTILKEFSFSELNGHSTERLANTCNISFKGILSEALLLLLDKNNICASSGSACLADSDEPSHVIHAMKPNTSSASEAIRFSLGKSTTKGEVAQTLEALRMSTRQLRHS